MAEWITRIGSKARFRYTRPDGRPVTDERTLELLVARGAALSIANGVYGFLLPHASHPDSANVTASSAASRARQPAPLLYRMSFIATRFSGP